MAPRLKTPRKVSELPVIKGFRPFGGSLYDKNPEQVNILLEEYEALRLCDFDHHTHRKAAEIMGISRPTFTRIYDSVLKKIALSFVRGRKIIIEGGHVYFDNKWCYCEDCESKFSNPEGKEGKISCPLCGSQKVSPMKEGMS